MDLSAFDVSEAASRGATLTLRNPATGEDLCSDDGKPITITLLGSDSSEYRKRIRATANQRINSRKKRTVEQIEQESIDMLAAVTQGWSGIVVDGEKVSFSQDEAKKLYRRFSWITEQVDEFVSDRSNFLTSA